MEISQFGGYKGVDKYTIQEREYTNRSMYMIHEHDLRARTRVRAQARARVGAGVQIGA